MQLAGVHGNLSREQEWGIDGNYQETKEEVCQWKWPRIVCEAVLGEA